GTDRRAAAAVELVRAVKESVGISVTCSVLDPDTLERSLGKLHRLVDHRQR
ncbi:MAG TPA: phenylacetate--CoA ligase, partial [Pseudonocardia sp.]